MVRVGLALTLVVVFFAPKKPAEVDRVYVEDETAGLPPGAPAFEPTA
ncbi:MAG TPA: hypothetical protein VLW05_08320 [Gaiellaceae bacterium]|jgi:hypothetical protein|nr:hypothetical protein [Gaiellaceae bacterium]